MKLWLISCSLAPMLAWAETRYNDSADYLEQVKQRFTTVDRDWEQQKAGEYLVENNVWNKQDTKEYRQSVGIRLLEHGAVTAGWAWEWPRSPVIVAFPDILYGKNPWAHESTTPLLPIRISDIASLTADLDLVHLGHGHRNTSFQIWLTGDSASEPQHIHHEVMIWLRNDSLPLAPFYKDVQVKGKHYTLTMMKNHGDPNLDPPVAWTYTAFVQPGQIQSGPIDLKAFLDLLVQEGIVSPRDYLALINLGNEVRDGSGLTVLRKYRITTVRQ